MKREELAYLGGVIDGRATLYFPKGGSPFLSFKMRGSLPKKFYKRLGGSYAVDRGVGWWRLYGLEASQLLVQLLPHLRHRKREARKLIQRVESK